MVLTDWSSHADQLILEHNLLVWERLHGFWRTIPSFNPQVVSSEPGQDLEGEARRLLFPSGGSGDANEEEEPEDRIVEEIEDPGLSGTVEGVAGDIDVDVGPEVYGSDALDMV